MVVINLDWIFKPRGIMKILSLFLNTAAISVLVHYGIKHRPLRRSSAEHERSAYFFVTSGGYFFLSVSYIFSYAFDSMAGKSPIQELLLDICAIPMMSACSGLAFDGLSFINPIIDTEEIYSSTMAYAIICLFLVVVYSLDAFFNFKRHHHQTSSYNP